mmetsp:Transcript_25414/g.38534  ORF Transcript_25414/g.38534 Transcript_25414/m.38534 type:complete len:83 (-) Transcript_25414:41-289(-)
MDWALEKASLQGTKLSTSLEWKDKTMPAKGKRRLLIFIARFSSFFLVKNEKRKPHHGFWEEGEYRRWKMPWSEGFSSVYQPT